ncbi:hypothetical protein [Priestia megaterium]|jgi:hypothetical protein|uniref:hypothetical protein n=1 Tax=Priestia megaterium TaxID=1404 RepID=UPI00211D0AFA|nr:hypothetical protein [Priestia megaterium]
MANNQLHGDCLAAEKLKNNSVCIKEGSEIRNIKSFQDICANQLVFVCNILPNDEEYVEEGKAVRYIPSKGMLF